MGIMTQLRGLHSSGIFVVDGGSVNKRPKIIKCVGPSVNLEFEKGYEAAAKLIYSTGVAAIGHGRHATRGAINKQNAHPFHHNGITLVHNGTIDKGLEEEMKGVEVDSHALTKAIGEKGVIDALHQIDGAYAIALHNANDGKIYIARNYERTLFYKTTHRRIYFMSAYGALEYLNYHNSLWAKAESDSLLFSANKVYVFDPNTGEMVVEDEIVKKPAVLHSLPPPTTTQVSYPSRTASTHKASTTRSDASGSKVPEQKLRRGENVEFVVRSFFWVAHENLYHYRAVDLDGNEIFFKTPVRQEAWDGRTGVGPICAVHLGLSNSEWKWSYQIKTREIVWDDIVVNEENTRDPEVVDTFDGVISKNDWKEICSKNQCESCRGALDPSKPVDTYVLKKNNGYKAYCHTCVDMMFYSALADSSKDLQRLIQ